MAGFLADLKSVNALLLHNVALVCAGVLCFVDVFCREYISMCFFAALFGLSIGLLICYCDLNCPRHTLSTIHCCTLRCLISTSSHTEHYSLLYVTLSHFHITHTLSTIHCCTLRCLISTSSHTEHYSLLYVTLSHFHIITH